MGGGGGGVYSISWRSLRTYTYCTKCARTYILYHIPEVRFNRNIITYICIHVYYTRMIRTPVHTTINQPKILLIEEPGGTGAGKKKKPSRIVEIIWERAVRGGKNCFTTPSGIRRTGSGTTVKNKKTKKRPSRFRTGRYLKVLLKVLALQKGTPRQVRERNADTRPWKPRFTPYGGLFRRRGGGKRRRNHSRLCTHTFHTQKQEQLVKRLTGAKRHNTRGCVRVRTRIHTERQEQLQRP